MITQLLSRALGLNALDTVYRRASAQEGGSTIWRVLQNKLDLRFEITDEDLDRIPKDGPVIVVANHPTGAMEGIALPALLDSVRGDVKTLAHTWFQRWPLCAERMFLVNPQAKEGNRATNSNAMKNAAKWIRQGKMLLLFPAGEVARFQVKEGCVTDSQWKFGLAYLVKTTRATVLPIHLSGRNSVLFQLLSLMHPRMGAMLLAIELLNKRGKSLRVRIGRPIPYEEMPAAGSPVDLVAYLRRAVERLDARGWTGRVFRRGHASPKFEQELSRS